MTPTNAKDNSVYTVPEVLSNIDARIWSILLFGIFVNGCAYVQYGMGIAAGFRDKSHAIPLAANTFFFAHDMVFVFGFSYWFYEVDHWFFQLNWGAMVIFGVLELIIAWQIITYSGKKLGLGSTRTKALLSYAAIQLGMLILFLWLKELLNDPLHLILFPITVVVSSLFNIPMLLQRNSRSGQSIALAIALVVQLPVYFFLLNPLLHDSFTSPIWYWAGSAGTVLASVYFWLLYRSPRA